MLAFAVTMGLNEAEFLAAEQALQQRVRGARLVGGVNFDSGTIGIKTTSTLEGTGVPDVILLGQSARHGRARSRCTSASVCRGRDDPLGCNSNQLQRLIFR